jgi:preprotein translocase subunit SecA
VFTSFNLPDDEPIESKIVTRAIVQAQGQVEAQNFEIRKNVLKYDEVLNRQRQVIYDERRKVLEGADLHEQVRHFIDDTVEAYVNGATSDGYAEEWDLEALWTALRQLYPVGPTIEEVIAEAGGPEALAPEFLSERLKDDAQDAYDRREQELGNDVMRELERRVVLSVLDRKWREHLYEMDYLKEGIGLRAMAQRDPLVEYQKDGFDLFNAMMDGIKEESVGFLFNLQVQVNETPADGTAVSVDGLDDSDDSDEDDSDVDSGGISDEADDDLVQPGTEPRAAVAAAARPDIQAKGLGGPARSQPLQYTAPSADDGGQTVQRSGGGGGASSRTGDFANVPRNAPCPCGSGKKFKRCHGDPRARVA